LYILKGESGAAPIWWVVTTDCGGGFNGGEQICTGAGFNDERKSTFAIVKDKGR